MSNLISAIEKSLVKLLKYFPKLTKNNIYQYKAYIIALVLDPRFKIRLFRNSLLSHFNGIDAEALNILKEEYYR